MPTTMSLWRLSSEGAAIQVEAEQLAAESVIESAVESAPELLGFDALIIGRQVPTPSGPLDLLAIDADAQLVVVENKRDRTPREVLAQTIDYAAYVSTLTFDDVALIYDTYCLRSSLGVAQPDLTQAFEERFSEPLDGLAESPRMLIVAARLDDSTERMIEFLAERFGVPVNAALFQPFEGSLIGRTWLRPDEPSRPLTRSTANSGSRDESKAFWDAWLPIGRAALPGIRLPANGPRSVLIKRRIVNGIPAALTVWVSSDAAYAEVQFDDDDPAMNDALLNALREHEDAVEQAYGALLHWRTQEAGGLMTKRTKVVTEKVDIGSRSKPTDDGLNGLASVAQRLVDAVKPLLSQVYEDASLIASELAPSGEAELGEQLSVENGQSQVATTQM